MDPCGLEAWRQVGVLLYAQKQDLVPVREFSVPMAPTNNRPFSRWKNSGVTILSQEHEVRELRGKLGSGWGFSKHFVWVPQASCSEVLGPVQHTSLGPGALPKLIRGSWGEEGVCNRKTAAHTADGSGCLSDGFFYHVGFFFHIRNFFFKNPLKTWVLQKQRWLSASERSRAQTQGVLASVT